jgi:hypothetical protein
VYDFRSDVDEDNVDSTEQWLLRFLIEQIPYREKADVERKYMRKK